MLRKMAIFISIASVVGTTQVTAQSVTGDPVAGKKAFGACISCHSLTPGQTGIGPHLSNIIGKVAGVNDAKFKYSPAMKAAPVWTEAQLDSFLSDPRKTIPGNTMSMAPVKDAGRRADIIAFLKADLPPQ